MENKTSSKSTLSENIPAGKSKGFVGLEKPTMKPVLTGTGGSLKK